MFKKISLIAALTINTCLGMSTLVVDRYHLQIPAEVGKAVVVLDNNKFHLILMDGSNYTFKPENLDADLREINPLRLAYSLGIIWNFEYKDTTYSSNSICPKAYEDFLLNRGSSKHHDHMVRASMDAKPAGAYLKIYRLDNGDLGLHLCPRLSGGGWWDWLFGPSDPLKGLKPACREFARRAMEEEVNPIDVPGMTICCDECRAYWEKRKLEKQRDPLGLHGFNLRTCYKGPGNCPECTRHCDECDAFWLKKECEAHREFYEKQHVDPLSHPSIQIHCRDCRLYWQRKRCNYDRDYFNYLRINPLEVAGTPIHCDECRAYWQKRKKSRYHDSASAYSYSWSSSESSSNQSERRDGETLKTYKRRLRTDD